MPFLLFGLQGNINQTIKQSHYISHFVHFFRPKRKSCEKGFEPLRESIQGPSSSLLNRQACSEYMDGADSSAHADVHLFIQKATDKRLHPCT